MKTELILRNQLHHGRSSRRAALLCLISGALVCARPAGAQPVVTNVAAAQQAPPSQLVNISYTISDQTHTNARITILVSKDSGATWTVPANSFTGAYGNVYVTPTPAAQSVVWNAGADWGGHYTVNGRVRVQANDSDLVVIPPATFYMGDSIGLGYPDETFHYVTISTAFNIEANLVTGGEWNLVVEAFAQANGYDLAPAQQGAASGPAFKAANHPVQQVQWYDAVKWCNARSQYEGATPVYYTDAGFTSVYKTGMNDNLYVNPAANGYRLPTEAQWECAARGGVGYQNFPWPGSNNISLSQANYTESFYYIGGPPTYSFTLPYYYEADTVPPGWTATTNSSLGGTYNANMTGGLPYTSPVGAYGTNGYGLWDMAGNVEEWCWDWYGQYYYYNGQIDPQGPATGTYRVARGGSWSEDPSHARCANRGYGAPSTANSSIGFRCVRGLF